MIRLGKRAAIAVSAGILAAASVTGCSGSLDTDAVVAVVGEENITLGVANFYARMTQGQYETYYASMLGTTADQMWAQEYSEDETMEDTVKEDLLESLETMYLMSQHAEEYGVALTEEEQEAIEAAAEKFDADNTEEAKSAVSGYKKDIEKVLELATIQSKITPLMREGVSEDVSDEEAAQKAMQYVYFAYTSMDEEGNSVELSDEEKAELKEKAQSLTDRAKAGEDFAAVAAELAAEPQTVTFDSESTSPASELIEAADALAAEGEMTDVIETENGVYVAKLTSLLDREATDAKKTSIVEERKQEQYDSLIEEWKEAADITVDKKVWAKISFADQGISVITSEEENAEGSTEETTEEPVEDTAE